MIDILLATYNGEKYLDEQIQSLINQNFQEWRLLIHDDNSNDKTTKIIRSYAERYPERIQFLDDTKSFGSASANFAYLLSRSKADYIMFCDQDDVWLPNKVEKSFSKMKKLEDLYTSKPLMVFSDLQVVDEEMNVLENSMWKSERLNPELVNDVYSILALNVVTGCTMMINNKAKQLVSPMPNHDILHDHWIAVNISKYGHSSYINEPLIKYRQHSSNVMGARSSGFLYFYKKTTKLLDDWNVFRAKYSHFSFKINLWKVLVKKALLNSQRLF
jgi:glycosyltransferase involved in cell wall biosynthesis